jgi:hypothetical protein
MLKSYINDSIIRYFKKKSVAYIFNISEETSNRYLIQFELLKVNNIHTTNIELNFKSNNLEISFCSSEIQKGFEMIDIIKFYNEISIMINHMKVDFLSTYQILYKVS